MRTQLQAISLRIQTVRSNEQMMQSMKGATSLLGSMNRQMNLPALQRIAMEFEKENDIMDQRQEMMDDAIDDVTGLEDEEEGEEVVKEVLDEIGVDLGQAVRRRGRLGGLSEQKTPMLTRLPCIRWAKHLQAFKRQLWLTDELQKPLAALEEEGVLDQTMMTCKLVWIAYGGSESSRTCRYSSIYTHRYRDRSLYYGSCGNRSGHTRNGTFVP